MANFLDTSYMILWVPEGMAMDAPLPALNTLSAAIAAGNAATIATVMSNTFVLRPYFVAAATSVTGSASVLNAMATGYVP